MRWHFPEAVDFIVSYLPLEWQRLSSSSENSSEISQFVEGRLACVCASCFERCPGTDNQDSHINMLYRTHCRGTEARIYGSTDGLRIKQANCKV